MIKTAKKIQKTTKKMVDDVFLKLVGLRVLERAKVMTEALKREKKAAAKNENKTSKKKASTKKAAPTMKKTEKKTEKNKKSSKKS